jgi:prevent-host-death family protein
VINNKKKKVEKMGSHKTNGSRRIKASEFKAKCLKLMDEVADSGKEIVITKNGHPVSRLVPYREKPMSLFGIDKGRIKILGDIIEPLGVEWEANTGAIRDDNR